MGDYFLTYGSGESYLKRVVYVNILLYVVLIIALIVFMVDIVILVLIAIIAVVASLAYSLFFIMKNPPRDYPEPRETE
ncbi:MAG: hypothetical protein ACFFF9_08275 [Candidatus Thorarchaeota archaeon]